MDIRLKNTIVSLSFAVIIAGVFLANIILPDNEFTFSERRRLAAAPAFSFESLISGEFFEEFDKYTLDQFIFRDAFRRIKAIGTYHIFRQWDNNDIYIIDGNISKMVYPLNVNSIKNAADKLNKLYDEFLKDKNVYYAVIPDKNYFLADKHGFLSMDYSKLLDTMQENVKNIKYIDLFDSLTIDDYYRTDIHWRQEKILGIADKLLKEMGSDAKASDADYEYKELFPFYGSLYGQSAMKAEPDSLIYLNNHLLDSCSVYDYEIKDNIKVYVPEKFKGIDPYDVYLSGAKPLLKITNNNAKNGRKLILFRDSFGSSIAPLLMMGYSEIVLVDLRYISSQVLDDYIDFSQYQDVLFLYNTQILNNSYLFR